MEANQIHAGPTVYSRIIGQVSIDNSGHADESGRPVNDNGFLINARKGHPQTERHTNTRQAIYNLRGGDDDKVLVGHGIVGCIITGGGQNYTDPTKYISVRNERYWQPFLPTLGSPWRSLVLCSCYTGYNAVLLSRLAQLLRCTVQGPTGMITCDATGDIRFAPGSIWRKVKPKTRSSMSIPEPSTFIGELADTFVLSEKSNKIEFKIDDVTNLSFIPLLRDGTNATPILALTNSAAQDMLKRLELSEPFTLPGTPGTLVTGRLVIGIERNSYKKSFLVLGDKVLQDEDQSEIYRYWSDDAARIILNSL